MSWYYLEKEFYDHAEDIEGVNIHYACAPLGEAPDWENQRTTRYMPFVQSSGQLRSPGSPSMPSRTAAVGTPARLRKKVLKLPQHILDPRTHAVTDRYLLYYYFEIFQDGHRRYSPLYTEEVATGGTSQPVGDETLGEMDSPSATTNPDPGVEESRK